MAFASLTVEEQKIIIERRIRFFIIDALKIAGEVGLGGRINTVMQACFFKIAGVLPEQEAIELMKKTIKKSFSQKGEDIVRMNWNAVDRSSEGLIEVSVPETVLPDSYVAPVLIREDSSAFARDVILPTMTLKGDDIPVSKMSFDGTLPIGTTKLEKRGVAPRVPKWIEVNCIQCNQCVQSCPHAAIRAKQIAPRNLDRAPESFTTQKSKTKNEKELRYRLQVYIEDCQACGVCLVTCPTKNKALEWSPIEVEREAGENANEEFFSSLPEDVLDGASDTSIKGLQFKQPLFEFSGACAGCGETPYVEMMSKIAGDRMIAANATGCSSIYGGTFPTIPYCKNKEGRGPAWGNSLFEDNAEYGFGMRLAVDNNRTLLKAKVEEILEIGTSPELSSALKKALEIFDNTDQEAKDHQLAIQTLLQAAKPSAAGEASEIIATIIELQDYFVDKSIWIIGGDGWAYDIGYSGLDHVISLGKNVNILVIDTEVYSNTGGQASKSTPIGAVAKFANSGKKLPKKNLPFMCMSYGHVYIASISLGANRAQAQKAMIEAEAYPGPSIIFAYATCITHGIDMSMSQVEMKRAVECGYWPLFRFDPRLEEGSRFQWESKEPILRFQEFIRGERRYSALRKTNPIEAEALLEKAEADSRRRNSLLRKIGEVM